MIKSLIMIFIGGGVGSILRYLVNIGCSNLNSVYKFPIGTFIANITGCFLIGLFSAICAKYVSTISNDTKMMMTVGFCGGLTTFSTFSNESLNMVRNGNVLTFAIYVGVSVTLGIMAAYLGSYIIKN